MPIFRWFWGLKLRWRIPLGLMVLLVLSAGAYVLVAWVQYRRTRSADLLDRKSVV